MATSQGFFNMGVVFERLWEHVMYEVNHYAPRVVVYSFILSFVIYLFLQRTYKPQKGSKDEKIDKETEEELINEFTPEPLVPAPKETDNDINNLVLLTAPNTHVRLEGYDDDKLNFATHNFLGLAGRQKTIESCKKTIEKYGVGSCGPRGFYGTIDVHLELEAKVAKFMGTPSAIVYSYGWTTISSVIPAFLKLHDLIICDEACNFAIQSGIYLSRSSVIYFKHNDMSHLEQILKDIAKKDNGKTVTDRRFICFQGVYESDGSIAPLKKIMELKHKYCYRLIMDDSFGIGVLGKNGRGTAEHFDIPTTDIEILSATLENSIGSIGGFCVGSTQVVEHQRLGGAAYCFSASLPPYLATASIESIDYITSNSSIILPKLRQNVDLLIKGLSKMLPQPLELDASPGVPIMHIRLKKNEKSERKQTDKKFARIVELALAQGVIVTRPQYSEREYQRPNPSIKICVSVDHTEDEINKCVSVLTPLLQEVFKQ